MQDVRYRVEDRGYRTPCWVWLGLRSARGYGRIVTPQRSVRAAHRVFWQQAHGAIPEGLVLDHLCRVPECVNPGHLEPVTHTENVRRGRNAKLTVDRVREIRERRESAAELAARFGVSTHAIESVWQRKTWKDVA